MNKLLTYVIMFDSLILVHVQFMIMLIELKKVLVQELKCLCSKTTTVLLEWTIPKAVDVSLLHFYCIRSILYRIVWTLYRNVYVLYVQYRYTQEVHMSTSGVVIHYIGWGFQSPNPQDTQYGKWEFCVWFAQRFFRNVSLPHNETYLYYFNILQSSFWLI